jgi:hypothetical protein
MLSAASFSLHNFKSLMKGALISQVAFLIISIKN